MSVTFWTVCWCSKHGKIDSKLDVHVRCLDRHNSRIRFSHLRIRFWFFSLTDVINFQFATFKVLAFSSLTFLPPYCQIAQCHFKQVPIHCLQDAHDISFQSFQVREFAFWGTERQRNRKAQDLDCTVDEGAGICCCSQWNQGSWLTHEVMHYRDVNKNQGLFGHQPRLPTCLGICVESCPSTFWVLTHNNQSLLSHLWGT